MSKRSSRWCGKKTSAERQVGLVTLERSCVNAHVPAWQLRASRTHGEVPREHCKSQTGHKFKPSPAIYFPDAGATNGCVVALESGESAEGRLPVGRVDQSEVYTSHMCPDCNTAVRNLQKTTQHFKKQSHS